MATLNPQAQALLELIASVDAPPMNELPVSEARATYRDRRHVTQPDAPAIGSTHDFDVDGIAVRRLLPKPSTVSSERAMPALVYLHGGGWTIGDLDTHDTLCRSLSNQAGCAVYSVDYRMGPEHKFPTAVNDAWRVLNWLVENATAENIDPARIAVGGDSAGANLAAVACLMARDSKGPSLCFQLLIYPATDQTQQCASHQRNGQGYLLTTELLAWFRDQYHASESEYTDWRASPLFADNHANLPPAFVLTAGFDPLVDEGKAYAGKLKQAGVSTESTCYDGQIHGFITMGRMIDEANEAVTVCANALKRAFS